MAVECLLGLQRICNRRGGPDPELAGVPTRLWIRCAIQQQKTWREAMCRIGTIFFLPLFAALAIQPAPADTSRSSAGPPIPGSLSPPDESRADGDVGQDFRPEFVPARLIVRFDPVPKGRDATARPALPGVATLLRLVPERPAHPTRPDEDGPHQIFIAKLVAGADL